MCLLIAKPAGHVIPEEYLRNGYNSNNHGAGFAVAKNGQLFVEKGFFKFEEFLDAYVKASENQTLPAMVHFRIGTSGGHDKDNCHPFQVGTMAMGHNGVLNDFSYHPTMSDTAVLADYLNVFEMQSEGIVTTKGMQEFLEDICGFGNKLVFINPDGEFFIVNEKKGNYEDNIWYSNNSHKREAFWAGGNLFPERGGRRAERFRTASSIAKHSHDYDADYADSDFGLSVVNTETVSNPVPFGDDPELPNVEFNDDNVQVFMTYDEIKEFKSPHGCIKKTYALDGRIRYFDKDDRCLGAFDPATKEGGILTVAPDKKGSVRCAGCAKVLHHSAEVVMKRCMHCLVEDEKNTTENLAAANATDETTGDLPDVAQEAAERILAKEAAIADMTDEYDVVVNVKDLEDIEEVEEFDVTA